jgi:ADP-ribosyl-[dinitrogen reductase] hydrolase
MTLQRSCLCGVVRYELDQLDMPIAHCHCMTCRKAHSAAYVSTAGVVRGHFCCTAGTERLATSELSAGKLRRRFCSACGSHLLAERPGRPHVMLRVATLDDDPGKRPAMHIWTSYDELWLTDREDVPLTLNGNAVTNPAQFSNSARKSE